MRYRITDDNGLKITFNAVSDRDTIINLTNHSYFTPNGMDDQSFSFRKPPETDNRDVELFINADQVLEINDNGIPTGKLISVTDTPFDFRSPRKLAGDTDGVPCPFPGGYDHTFVLNPHRPEQPVAVAKGLKSGVRIAFYTDQPGAQLFTMGNPGTAFAFEAQHFPDSPNHPGFPDTILRAGDCFRSVTVYQFTEE